MATKTDYGNIGNALVRKLQKSFVQFFPWLLMTWMKKMTEKTKTIFSFMKIPI